MTHLPHRLDRPLLTGPPRHSLPQGLVQQRSKSVGASSGIKLIEQCKTQFPQLPTFEPDPIGVLNVEKTVVDKKINKRINFFLQDILILISMGTLNHFQDYTGITHQ